MWRYLLALATCAVILAAAIGAAAPVPLPRAHATLPQSAYVWQRAWTADTAEAVRQPPPAISEYQVLAVEIETAHRHLTYHWANYDATVLRGAGRPVGLVGLVVRMGPWFGGMELTGAAYLALEQAARGAGERARAGGLTVTDLQIDFDCASRRLGDYATWLGALRRALPGTHLSFTALPCWLEQPEFAALAAAADRFVLQVHWLARPGSIDQPRTLCDAAAARRAVEQAARLGRPFQVALPTYGYLLSFDGAGRYIGLAAETDVRATPAGGQVVALDSDARAMVALMREWQVERPGNLTGVIWFRLPTAADRRGWSRETFAAVTAGQAPQPALRVRLQADGTGRYDLVLENTGTADATIAPTVSVTWAASEAILLAADGCNGYQVEAERAGACRLVAAENRGGREPFCLRPQALRTIGWVRFSTAEIHPEVVAP